MDSRLALIAAHIRNVPDFPRPGILFRDITPLLAAPHVLAAVIEVLAERYAGTALDHIVAIESRGFLFAAPLSVALKKPLHLIRKPGKLPWSTERVSYTLEYGFGALEIQHDEIVAGGRALVIDDLLATGGTAAAADQLIAGQGGRVVEAAFLIELAALNGRAQLKDVPCFALLSM